MPKYYITYKIDARYVVMVESENFEEAKKKADEEFQDANLNESEVIDSEAIIAEDEKGNLIWEK